MSAQTPLMQQFHQFKSKVPDAILFMRCGDFYEMFYEDARTVARELQIVLTSRNKNSENPVPMAGVPYHAYEDYAAKLVEKGYKIAICEQVEDPKEAKGIVKRDIVQVITPGTVTLPGVLDPKTNNFLGSLHLHKGRVYFCYLDVSTGEGFQTSIRPTQKDYSTLREELLRVRPSELLIHQELCEDPQSQEYLLKSLLERNIQYQRYEKRISSKARIFFDSVKKPVLNSSGMDRKSDQRFAWEMLFEYMESCSIQAELVKIEEFRIDGKLLMDSNTIRNLELINSQYQDSKESSLLAVLDRTSSAAGARQLKQYLLNPLLNPDSINARLDIVEAFKENRETLDQTIELLKGMYDLFRLSNRLLNQHANARDLIAIQKSLTILPTIQEILPAIGIKVPLEENLETLVSTISRAIVDDPPAKITEGGLFQRGYHSKLDEILDLQENADSHLEALENKEREITGLKSMKIKYNKVFGFYFEVPKSQSSQVPERFIRKQTLTNAERYTTDELKEKERAILQAREEAQKLEYKLFQELRKQTLDQVQTIYQWAVYLANLDVLCSFASLACENNYCRPVFHENPTIEVSEGRHPVVEAFSTSFVPNDLFLSQNTDLVHLVTGPNMGGKSTYLRQAAILTIMAQMGSFVPAKSYNAMIFERIFTRVGASDDLAQGKSTFMVEMAETAYLLGNANPRSLVLLDEVGRGTATFDGLSLAWSVLEYILEDVNCLTLFATHYHELTGLQQLDSRVKNYCVSVLESGSEVLFLHKIKRGTADRSYGIHVAKLAGMPSKLIRRANSLLKELEASKSTVIGLDTKTKQLAVKAKQSSFPGLSAPVEANGTETLEKLREINPDNLTPREALELLFELKESLQNDEA